MTETDARHLVEDFLRKPAEAHRLNYTLGNTVKLTEHGYIIEGAIIENPAKIEFSQFYVHGPTQEVSIYF